MSLNRKFLLIIILLFIIPIHYLAYYEPKNEVKVVKKEENSIKIEENVQKVEDIEQEVVETVQKDEKNDVISSFDGIITHYGPDCSGCSGITASGYDVRNNIYYNDETYGKVRIAAADKSIPFYSILRISDYKEGEIIVIVLDRGGAIQNNKIDILVSSEKIASNLGIQKNVKIELLREGK